MKLRNKVEILKEINSEDIKFIRKKYEEGQKITKENVVLTTDRELKTITSFTNIQQII